MTDFEITQLFNPSVLMKLNESIQRAYGYADIYIQDMEILRLPSAAPARQIVRNLSVDLMLERDCKSGRLPMKYKYTNNLAKNCKHIELFYEGKILTHSSVDKNILPRRSIFRENYASTNQISLDDPEGHLTFLAPSFGVITHQVCFSKDRSCTVCLVIPDNEYGHACNQIPLHELSKPLMVAKPTADFEDFNFELKKRVAEENVYNAT